MVVRTDSAEIRGLRQEILKLVLSEHPGSCLFCGEKDECIRFQGTIRKSGMTTGCRYCPNDGRCELQQITEKVGLTETSYPVSFRNLPVEKDDPFYDRDYNLCVLCGRCVRICNALRMNGTLSFKRRGKLTTIGPAFDRSHLDGGCEFCGACVSVCPTGALSVKTSKWYGKPDREKATTCPYCSVGCRLVTQVKNDHVVDTLPDYGSPVDRGMVCVKGRFAVPELVNSPTRLLEPRELGSHGYEVVTWDRAVDAACEKLSAAGPDGFLMLLSTQLSNEDLFVAQRFARQVMGSESMASRVAMEMGDSMAAFLNLACFSDPLDSIDEADAILTVGFDSRFGYSPIGIRVKRSVERGAKLATLNDMETNLDLVADQVFHMDPSGWADLLAALLSPGEDRLLSPDSGSDAAAKLEQVFDAASRRVMVVGPNVPGGSERDEILRILAEIRRQSGWKTVVAHPYTNLSGMVAVGALPGVGPAAAVSRNLDQPPTDVAVSPASVDVHSHRKVIYAIGEACLDRLPSHDYLIYQNAFPPVSACQPDLILPSALFTESAGTTVSVEGRLLATVEAVKPLGESKPDWWILGRIGEKMNCAKLGCKELPVVQAEIRKHFKGLPDPRKGISFVKFAQGENHHGAASGPAAKAGEGETASTLRKGNTDPETYRGVPLSDVVPGMRRIARRLPESLSGSPGRNGDE
jgi:predicted molibdopterin-dependent oxidoreductase YjgC